MLPLKLNKLNNLSREILDQIKEYLSPKQLVFLNKTYYILYHPVVRLMIPKTRLESYIRYMLKKDCNIPFNEILNENYKRWIGITKYMYKNITYANYLYFIRYYLSELKSPKCQRILNDFFLEKGLCKNQHKKRIYNIII